MRWRFWRRAARISPELARMERTVLQMDPVTREVFLLHRLDSLDYREISERLAINLPQVERRMAEAMCHLMQADAEG